MKTPKLGATGDYPEGKLHEHDEGGLVLGIARDKKGLVHVDFGTPVSWFAVPPETAIMIARELLKHAGVKKVEIEL